MTNPAPVLRAISLGAGVQSTAMYLMACAGELGPKPDAAIFADTGWEPQAIYDHLAKLEADPTLTIPIYRVSAGNIREKVLASQQGDRYASMPFFIDNAGKAAMGRRQCTREYKIEPITRKVRELIGLRKRQRMPQGAWVESWQGISLDEVVRMKINRVKWITNRYPLIFDRPLTRTGCENYLRSRGWSAFKSACIGCPFHSQHTWREMKLNDPASFADAVEFDRLIREGGNLRGMKHSAYLHRSLLPLGEVDFSSAEDRGQGDLFGGFNQECEGLCGV